MKKCDFCGKETDDYKVIKELDNQIMCQECIEKEIDVWREAFANVDENDTPYDYGYEGEWMIEEIRWFKYPENKPKLGSRILAQSNDGEFEFAYYARKLTDGKETGEPTLYWTDYNPDRHCYESREKDVVAWAYQIKGWNKDEIDRSAIYYMNGMANQIIAYANKLREMFTNDGSSLDTNNGLCAAWILLKKYFPDLVKRIDEE